ncbi:MAG: excinuclease ABC subunit UvrC [Chloroflexi bacterium]|nr:excinuclease ABC subunit UvrC [Chloroflexota bacterium]
MAESLLERLKSVPRKPGVYIFRNERAQVIYVGKAAVLRTRMRSYFGGARSMEHRTRILREKIADFEYVVTHTEQEALHLEATLVKRHQPFFNVRLKDDKHYPYLKVDLNDPFPRIYITRRVEKDGARYFGPYASASSIRKTLDVTKKLFPWRTCTMTITGKEARPCLEYYIHRCIAPCTAYCTQEEYAEVIRQTILFLEGRTDEVIRNLRAQMSDASEALEFERASHVRDQIRAIERVTEKQTVASTRPLDADIFGLSRKDAEAVVQVLFVRGVKMVGTDSFTLAGAADATDGEVLGSFIKQFYESATYVPRRLVLPVEVAETELVGAWLEERRGGPVRMLVPQRGEKKRLVQMAQDNAKEAQEQAHARWLADTGKTEAALDELEEELNLPATPHRIECYDISNIQGTNSVGSMVVFIDGRPRPQEYRRFKIRTVEGADDFASIAEVLRRRFKKATAPAEKDGQRPQDVLKAQSWKTLPDLLIVDGGKGQLNAALDVMRDLGVEHVPAAGLAKRNEELFVKDMEEPIVLPRTSQALFLVQRVRDEAHRFAITYHRKLRAKRSVQSALDAVPGVGPKKKKALLRKFGSVKAVREADVDDIAATLGFTRKLAARVKELV